MSPAKLSGQKRGFRPKNIAFTNRNRGHDRRSENCLRVDVGQQNTYLVPLEFYASWDLVEWLKSINRSTFRRPEMERVQGNCR